MDKNIHNKIYSDFNQYRADMFQKLGVNFEAGRSILDIGSGDCTDAKVFKNIFGLDVLATDIYKNQNADAWQIPFEIVSIYNIGDLNKKFDYVFLHDVLHHVDEETQSQENHTKALESIKQVVRSGGAIIIIEGNRYNPLFLPHMVKIRGHEHLSQKYFKDLVQKVFPAAKFKIFEAHAYPPSLLKVFKIYEKTMESLVPKAFLSYNAAIVDNYEEK